MDFVQIMKIYVKIVFKVIKNMIFENNIIYYLIISIMFILKILFAIGSFWYVVNGLLNVAIILMFLLYFVAFTQSQFEIKYKNYEEFF